MKTSRAYPKRGFWRGEKCEYCRGDIQEKEVDLFKKIKGTYFIFQHVPAGVCQECGVRYYTANTLKLVSQKLQFQKKTKRTRVALLNLAAA